MNHIEQERLQAINEMIEQQQFQRAEELIDQQLENPLNSWEYTLGLQQLQATIDFLEKASQPLADEAVLALLKSASIENQMIGISKLSASIVGKYKSIIEDQLATMQSEFRGMLLLKLKELGLPKIHLQGDEVDLQRMVDPYEDAAFLWGYQQLETLLNKEVDLLELAHITLTVEVLSNLPGRYVQTEMEEMVRLIVRELRQSMLGNSNLS